MPKKITLDINGGVRGEEQGLCGTLHLYDPPYDGGMAEGRTPVAWSLHLPKSRVDSGILLGILGDGYRLNQRIAHKHVGPEIVITGSNELHPIVVLGIVKWVSGRSLSFEE